MSLTGAALCLLRTSGAPSLQIPTSNASFHLATHFRPACLAQLPFRPPASSIPLTSLPPEDGGPQLAMGTFVLQEPKAGMAADCEQGQAGQSCYKYSRVAFSVGAGGGAHTMRLSTQLNGTCTALYTVGQAEFCIRSAGHEGHLHLHILRREEKGAGSAPVHGPVAGQQRHCAHSTQALAAQRPPAAFPQSGSSFGLTLCHPSLASRSCCPRTPTFWGSPP